MPDPIKFTNDDTLNGLLTEYYRQVIEVRGLSDMYKDEESQTAFLATAKEVASSHYATAFKLALKFVEAQTGDFFQKGVILLLAVNPNYMFSPPDFFLYDQSIWNFPEQDPANLCDAYIGEQTIYLKNEFKECKKFKSFLTGGSDNVKIEFEYEKTKKDYTVLANKFCDYSIQLEEDLVTLNRTELAYEAGEGVFTIPQIGESKARMYSIKSGKISPQNYDLSVLGHGVERARNYSLEEDTTTVMLPTETIIVRGSNEDGDYSKKITKQLKKDFKEVLGINTISNQQFFHFVSLDLGGADKGGSGSKWSNIYYHAYELPLQKLNKMKDTKLNVNVNNTGYICTFKINREKKKSMYIEKTDVQIFDAKKGLLFKDSFSCQMSFCDQIMSRIKYAEVMLATKPSLFYQLLQFNQDEIKLFEKTFFFSSVATTTGSTTTSGSDH
ncbi:hypothetical protein [Marinomonas transparens]|uniref:Uncharacterized protein n=1 Tax=Marinomonas transparens TaxID=2795388 RepID=A0A934JLW7_9GAMM|nr:hypothetical protein [Marinomonas transparens]MBJ7536459.1 hypothetical protein [Marinomonas transparens]